MLYPFRMLTGRGLLGFSTLEFAKSDPPRPLSKTTAPGHCSASHSGYLFKQWDEGGLALQLEPVRYGRSMNRVGGTNANSSQRPGRNF